MSGDYQTGTERTGRRRFGLWATGMLTLVSLIACGDAGDQESQKPPMPTEAPAAETPAPEPPPVAPEPSPSPAPATPSPAPEAPEPDAGGAGPLVERGKTVYGQACIACHNVDPTLDGPLGPAIAGSSLALIQARVVRGDYPEGYTPKRNTRAMVALPHLEPDVPALAAYLESLDPGAGGR